MLYDKYDRRRPAVYATELLRLPAEMILEYAKMAFAEDNDNVNLWYLLNAKGICFVCVCLHVHVAVSRTWLAPFPLRCLP